MNYYYGMAWLLGLLLWQSPLYSQSVNLDNFAQIQALNIQNCAVVQVNASWNHANRVKVEKLCLLYTSPSPRDLSTSRMPSSA